MKVLDDGRVQCRVKIVGTCLDTGEVFEYIDPEDSEGSQFYWPNGDPSTFWWSEGNMSCDCNRGLFVGIDDKGCGSTICIDTIEAIDFDGKILELNETSKRKV